MANIADDAHGPSPNTPRVPSPNTFVGPVRALLASSIALAILTSCGAADEPERVEIMSIVVSQVGEIFLADYKNNVVHKVSAQ